MGGFGRPLGGLVAHLGGLGGHLGGLGRHLGSLAGWSWGAFCEVLGGFLGVWGAFLNIVGRSEKRHPKITKFARRFGESVFFDIVCAEFCDLEPPRSSEQLSCYCEVDGTRQVPQNTPPWPRVRLPTPPPPNPQNPTPRPKKGRGGWQRIFGSQWERFRGGNLGEDEEG